MDGNKRTATDLRGLQHDWGNHVLSRCADLHTCALWRILDLTREMGLPIELGELLQRVIDAALDVLQAERGTVFLYDADRDELYSKVATGEHEIRFPADAGIAGETAQSRELVNVTDCYADARFNRDIDKKTGFRTRCLLSVPLIGHDDRLVGVLQVLNKIGGVFKEDDAHLALALAAQCAVAIQRAILIEEQLVKQKLERDLALAREIQMRVLPASMPQAPGYELAGWSCPADETGGDIYDAVPLGDGRVALLLGDATGHGIGPALSVTQVRAMLRMALRLHADLDTLFAQINTQLHTDLPGNRFVTAFVGILDPQGHRVEYHSGGQGPLLHYRAESSDCAVFDASTIPLGVLAETIGSRPAPMAMGPGDVLALISDGVFEYLGPDGKQFGLPRVQRVLRENHHRPPHQIIEAIRTAVAAFAGNFPQEDDMTMVIVRRNA